MSNKRKVYYILKLVLWGIFFFYLVRVYNEYDMEKYKINKNINENITIRDSI